MPINSAKETSRIRMLSLVVFVFGIIMASVGVFRVIDANALAAGETLMIFGASVVLVSVLLDALGEIASSCRRTADAMEAVAKREK